MTMARSTVPPSPISLSLAILLCIAFACADSPNQVEHRELDRESSKRSEGFAIPSHIEKRGQDAIKEYLDSLFTNALFGHGSSETGQNIEEAYPGSYVFQPQNITQTKEEGETNMDADKPDYKHNKKLEEEHNRLTIPSHIEKEGQDSIKKYLDNLFSNALFGSDLTETGQNLEAHNSETYSLQPHSKTQIKDEDERNMDAHKSSHRKPKRDEEEELLDDNIVVNVELEMVRDEEYVLKIKKITNPSSTNENEVERAKEMAQNGAMLLHYGEILQEMGEKLLTQSQASLYSVFKMPAPPKLKSNQ